MDLEIGSLNFGNSNFATKTQEQQTQKEDIFYGIKPAVCKMGNACLKFDESNLNDNQLEFYNKISESYSSGHLAQETYDIALSLLKNSNSKFDIEVQFAINQNAINNKSKSYKDILYTAAKFMYEEDDSQIKRNIKEALLKFVISMLPD